MLKVSFWGEIKQLLGSFLCESLRISGSLKYLGLHIDLPENGNIWHIPVFACTFLHSPESLGLLGVCRLDRFLLASLASPHGRYFLLY